MWSSMSQKLSIYIIRFVEFYSYYCVRMPSSDSEATLIAIFFCSPPNHGGIFPQERRFPQNWKFSSRKFSSIFRKANVIYEYDNILKAPHNFKSHCESFWANICLFKVNNGNTRKRYEIVSKLAIKTPVRRQ